MHPILDVLRREAPHFAAELSTLATQRGLAVTLEEGAVRPIPITATPVILEASDIQARSQLAALLASATVKMVRALLGSDEKEALLGALSPLERRMAERTWQQAQRLATTRVDFFVDSAPRALELNATIPAMQGYSDIAANTFIEVVGRHLGLPAKALPALQRQNGNNAQALYSALLEAYALERPGALPQRIALVCRRNDSQVSELRYLAERFSELGTEAEVLHPDELSGDERFEAHGKVFDLVYRHLFLRRLEQKPNPYLEDFFATVPGKKAVFLNPPASQYEVKAAFAYLSEAIVSPARAQQAGLNEAEFNAVKQAVPWTRRFVHASGTTPEGEKVADLVQHVAAHPEQFVLKRSWDYGGKTVFLGRLAGTAPYAERVQATYGASLAWPELCERAAQDTRGGGLVVQALVDSPSHPYWICSEEGLSEASLFVDYSAYASVGLSQAPSWGGVCRGSSSEIVNILGGGGVIPLLTTDVADALYQAFQAQ